jgi:hypothetical protein
MTGFLLLGLNLRYRTMNAGSFELVPYQHLNNSQYHKMYLLNVY